jgi:hypothetical protein
LLEELDDESDAGAAVGAGVEAPLLPLSVDEGVAAGAEPEAAGAALLLLL